MKVLQCLVGHGRRRVHHQVSGLGSLRKRNYFSYVILARHEHHQPIDAWCDSTVGGSAEFKGRQKMPEPPVDFLLAITHKLEYVCLHITVMDAYRAG